VALIYISPALTLIVFVLLPLSGLLIGILGKKLRSMANRGREKYGDLISVVEETLSGLRIIKAFTAESRVFKRFSKENESFTKIITRVTRIAALASPLSEFLGTGIIMVILYIGSSFVFSEKNSLAPQDFIGYLLILTQIINPIKSLSNSYYNIQKGLASFDRVKVITEAEDIITEKEDAHHIDKFMSNIEFKNVSFFYDEKGDVLKNINLKIEKGKTIALVGQSGSGKSTLVDLLPRFYDVQEGEITIDGYNINDLKLKNLRDLMGNVNQESILFNDTIFNNIAFGVDNATMDEVIEAAKVANAHDFIMETPEGYNTSIGDRGGKLSGGQRQRISIARAVLKNPPILILDEATSALDTESERLVQDALVNLMKNRTSIVIAHRLSTIKHADEICVLHEGRIVESGNHFELIEKNGIYKKLHDLQMF
jgi:subfamily B ATP-binding cassette protein MsbA